jgi:hypothetical protein
LKASVLLKFISDLESKKILKSDKIQFFKDNIKEIFGPSEFTEDEMLDVKTQELISEFFEDPDLGNKRSFATKYFKKNN